MIPTIGIVANTCAGQDLRRLVAHAAVPNDMSRIAELHAIVAGARSVGVERILIAADAHGLVERARPGLGQGVEIVGESLTGTGDDTRLTALAMRESGAAVLVVSGGDGTHRDVAKGWRDAPMVAMATGTNNAFPQMLEPSVAGTAAGLVATSGDPLDNFVAYRALVIDIEIEGSFSDLALVSAAVTSGDLRRSGSLWEVTGVDQVFAAVAEPWSVGPSALAGVIAPTSRTDDRGVLLDLDPQSPQRILAPLAPGEFVDAGLRSVSVVDLDQPVAVRGPVGFVLDGERIGRLAGGEWASMTIRRDGPRVIDIRRTFSIAVRRSRFYRDGIGDTGS